MDINNKRILATSVLILLVCGVYLFVLEKDIKEMREQNRQILNSLGELNSKVNTARRNRSVHQGAGRKGTTCQR